MVSSRNRSTDPGPPTRSPMTPAIQLFEKSFWPLRTRTRGRDVCTASSLRLEVLTPEEVMVSPVIFRDGGQRFDSPEESTAARSDSGPRYRPLATPKSYR